MTEDGRILLPPLPDEFAATYEGAEYEVLRRTAAWTFRQRLEWNEQVCEMARRFATARTATPKIEEERP